MKIIDFRAENFKRLNAVHIKPDGKVVKITGRNGQGKSSVLDAIWAALGGGDAIPAVPVREGQNEATIVIDLGEYKVTRKIRNKLEGEFTTSLVVEGADGMKASKPQNMLNDLVGKFSLDPMEFVRLAPEKQYDALKHLVPGIDLDEIKRKNDEDYERRTVENRKAKEAHAAAATTMAKDGKVERIDTAPILADIERASDHNKELTFRGQRREQTAAFAAEREKAVEDAKARIEAIAGEIEALKQEATVCKAVIEVDGKAASEAREKLANAPPIPEPLDTAKLAGALAEATAVNQEADKQESRDRYLDIAKKHEGAAEALTEAIDARNQEVAAAIAAAKFPVEGLSLGDKEVLINGVPFAQAATSQKIRTSVSLAMAMNPKVRVIRIMEGSILDNDAMKIIADMAEASDFQIWVETVGDGTGSGIIIEDGHIKE